MSRTVIGEGRLDDAPALIEQNHRGDLRGSFLPHKYEVLRTHDKGIVAVLNLTTGKATAVDALTWEPIVPGAGRKVLIFEPRRDGFIKSED